MRIMAHYREVVVFLSAKAAVLLGAWELPSKTTLLDYSTKTIARQPDLKITMEDVYLGHDMLVIPYVITTMSWPQRRSILMAAA